MCAPNEVALPTKRPRKWWAAARLNTRLVFMEDNPVYFRLILILWTSCPLWQAGHLMTTGRLRWLPRWSTCAWSYHIPCLNSAEAQSSVWKEGQHSSGEVPALFASIQLSCSHVKPTATCTSSRSLKAYSRLSYGGVLLLNRTMAWNNCKTCPLLTSSTKRP